MRLDSKKECLVYGDIDHCPNEDTANIIFQMICEEFNVDDNQISKSFCYKEEQKEYSYHWSIPTLKSNLQTLKHIFKQEKYTAFNDIVDTSIYCNRWFRLPYQTAKEKPLTHKIIQGNPEDFFVQHVPEDTSLFHYEIIEIKKYTKQKEKKPIVNSMKTNFTEEKYKIADLIDVKYLTNYDSWLSILWAMKSEGFKEEQAKQISQKASNYTEEGFMNGWNKPKEEITITQGTLNHYAKSSNLEEYYKIQDYGINKIFNDYTDEGLGQIVVNEMGQDMIYQDGELYIYFYDTWIKNNDVLCKSLFTDCLRNVFNQVLSILTKEKNKTADEDQQEKIEKQMKGILNALKEIKKIKTKNNVFQAVIITLS